MVTHRVLIESYRGELKHRLDARAVDAGGVKVDEAEVVIGAAGDQLVATRDHAIGEGLRVGENLLLIGEELGRRRLKGGDAERLRGAVTRGGDAMICGDGLRRRCERGGLILDVWFACLRAVASAVIVWL